MKKLSREVPIDPARAALLITDVQHYCVTGKAEKGGYFHRSLRETMLPNIRRRADRIALTGACQSFTGPLPSIGARHAEHVLADIGEDQIGRDRRGLVEASLAPFALDVVFLREGKPAIG